MRLGPTLKITFYVICLLTGGLIAWIIITNKPVPKGEEGPEAEALADTIMGSIGCTEWHRTRYVAWTFKGRHHYVWDKYYHLAEIKYGNIRVLLNVDTVDGIVWKDGKRLSLYDKRKYIAQAWKYWCNDSFWLNPICKIRDDGTVRKLVELDDGQEALLVTYTQGGVTPGDSFLWIVDENYRPVAWRMWVKILPLRGWKATWENWVEAGESQVATLHHIGPYEIRIGDLRTGGHHSELGLEKDPFEDFVTE